VCKNNLRQIGLGLHLYASDAGGAFVAASFPPPYHTWFDDLAPYVKDKWPQFNLLPTGRTVSRRGAFACPAYSKMPGVYAAFEEQGNCFGAYAYNNQGLAAGDGGTKYPGGSVGLGGTEDPDAPPRRLLRPTFDSDVVNPSNMLAIGDSTFNVVEFAPLTPGGIRPIAANFGVPWLEEGIRGGVRDLPHERQLNRQRHSSRFNVFCVDGHVEIGRFENYFQIRNYPQRRRRWAIDDQPHPERIIQF